MPTTAPIDWTAEAQAINPNGTTSRVDFVSKRVPYHGVTGEVVANVHRNVGLVANFSATLPITEFR